MIMNWIMNNYQTILIILIGIIGIAIILFKFLKLTPEEQKRRINLVLLDACREAEQLLGSRTGKAKRALVYVALRTKMPIISLFLSEEQYDKFLDTALSELKEWLEKNAAAAEKICE